MKMMNFRNFLKFKINESLKDVKLNKILDKISKKLSLSKSEQEFLDNYESINDDELKDHKMITKESAYSVIKDLISSGKKVICNLVGKEGKIGEEIKSIENVWDSESSIIFLKNGKETHLHDRFLYNIICGEDSFSLEEYDEFFEKIPVKDEN